LCVTAISGGGGLKWVILVGSTRSRRPRYVRYASNTDRINASQQSVATCHKQTSCVAAKNVLAARPLPSYDLLAAASLRERGPDRRCKKLNQGRDVRDRFNIEDGLLNRRLAI
jgi:hypothetical protein